MRDWRRALLQAIGAKPTQGNLKFLTGWQRWEGGHTKNKARFNWLNTTRNGPGHVRNINSVGVSAFDNFQHGIQATAGTLQSGRYDDIIAALRGGNPYKAKPVAGLSTWLSGSPTSKSGRAYAAKVLGTKVSAKDTRAMASSAYNNGPAAVVNSMSPRDMLGAFQQAASQAIMAAGTEDWFSSMMGLSQAKQNLNMASAEFAAAEGQARQYGGTTQAVGRPTDAEMQGTSDQLRTILAAADAQVGKPYVWGAESPAEGGFDCSGLIDWAFKQAGIDLPGRLTTHTAARMGVSVKGKPYKPGDWLITNKGGHMVMYVGNGKVIAAPRRGEVVQYQDVDRFANSIVDVRRVLK